LAQKQINEEPMAIFMGALRIRAKAGTKTAPVPIPKNPGRIPATPPMANFPHNEPSILVFPACSVFVFCDWVHPSIIIRTATRQNVKPAPRSSHLCLLVKYRKIREKTTVESAPATITATTDLKFIWPSL